MNSTNLTKEEYELLDRLTLLAIYNGNHIEPKALEPTPEEYRTLFDIRKKFGMSNK